MESITPSEYWNLVSIPFKRESISKAGTLSGGILHEQGFNSLQTGKYIQSICGIKIWKVVGCFNSLQTGKYIQSPPPTLEDRTRGYRFNSLQTGKYIQSLCDTDYRMSQGRRCFNSLQTGKYIQRKMPNIAQQFMNLKFQFPSNGKVYPKVPASTNYSMLKQVSIPFKRESISKEEKNAAVLSRPTLGFNSLQTGKYIQSTRCCSVLSVRFRFNSLQTGKYIQREFIESIALTHNEEFQFPSNGKVYPKCVRCIPPNALHWMVSIPFKRESISKGVPEGISDAVNTCFNSLQTGKYIQSRLGNHPHADLFKEVSIPFKRESISKDIRKRARRQRKVGLGFNSLQTGKYIQSGRAILLASFNFSSFNSLQTGKYIQRNADIQNREHTSCFNSLQTGKYIQSQEFLQSYQSIL